MKLREKHLDAINLQLEGHSISQVEAALGIPRTTFLRWRKDPDYQAELEKGRAHRMPELRGRCADYAAKGLESLRACIEAPDASWAERNTAAKILLDRAGLEPAKDNQAIDVNFSVLPHKEDTEASYMKRLTEMARAEREKAH